jgi:hypothetical protein
VAFFAEPHPPTSSTGRTLHVHSVPSHLVTGHLWIHCTPFAHIFPTDV